jgi:CRP/FNR family cyclic AMP-dependent transcriptional regulator
MQAALRIVRNENRRASRAGEFFKSLSPQTPRDFESFELCSTYPANVVLFLEHQTASHVLFLLEGRVKIFIDSSDGRRLILRIAKPGEILGLTAALSGGPHEMTAETLHLCKMASLYSSDFLGFLMHHTDSCRSVGRELNREYSRICEQLHRIGVASCRPAKVARLLEWFANADRLSTVLAHSSHFCSTRSVSASESPAKLSLVR